MYCCGTDRSRPKVVRIRAICSVDAASPPSTAAGSPGVRRSIRNTRTETTSRTGTVASRRRPRNWHMSGWRRGGLSVLLQVPVDVAVGDEKARDVLRGCHRLVELTERHVRADLKRARVQLVRQLLLRHLVGGPHELIADRLHFLV